MKALTILAFVALAGCAGGAPTAPVGQEFVIAAGQTAVVSGTGLSITFVRVPQDSRCPMGELCIWAGNAQVELIATLNGAPKTLSLNTPTGQVDGAVAPYKITLKGLLPIPSIAGPHPIPQADYRATLVIGFLPD
jgi:hypothetical protein